MNASRSTRSVLLLAAATAVVARLPALRAWWCLDDWGQLAGAAGLVERSGGARWISQHLYWAAAWPPAGLSPAPHAVLRILLHALGAATVARIGLRAGLSRGGALLAGLLFAAGPVSFTPLFWASGIQELLGTTLALLALERWLAGGRGGLLAAGALGVAAIFSKEAALALPPSLVVLWLGGRRPAPRHRALGLAVIGVLAAAAVVEARLVLGHFARGAEDAYATGGPGTVLVNLARFGWWLATPTARFTNSTAAVVVGGGAAVWAAWSVAAVWRWRHGDRVPAAALAAAVLTLVPALPLVRQAHPYLAYAAAAAGAVALGALLPRRLRLRPVAAVAAAAVAAAWGFLTMEARLAARDAGGRPADPVVRATAMSRSAADRIDAELAAGARRLVFLQPAVAVERAARSRRDPRAAVAPSPRWSALGGDLGPRLLAGPEVGVVWTTSLTALEPGDRVLCETSTGFRPWGDHRTALYYAALLDVGLGHDDRAVAHLRRARALGADPDRFVYEDAKSGARTLAARRTRRFADHLAAAAAHGRLTSAEAAALHRDFLALLAS